MSNYNRFTPEAQQIFVRMLREGRPRFQICNGLNVSAYAIQQAMKEDQGFREAVLLAEEEAAEPIENVLRDAALNGEPWAVKLYLEKRSPRRWGPNSATANVQIAISNSELPALQERLEARKLELESGSA